MTVWIRNGGMLPQCPGSPLPGLCFKGEPPRTLPSTNPINEFGLAGASSIFCKP